MYVPDLIKKTVIAYALALSLTILSATGTGQTAWELDRKSAGGFIARMWRTTACKEIQKAQSPSLARTGRGDLLLLFSHQPDGQKKTVLATSRSNDEGKTWSSPMTAYTPAGDSARALGTLTCLNSGRLIAPFIDDGIVKLLRSADDGTTWNATTAIDNSPLAEATPHGRLLETDNEVLMPVFGKLDIGQRQTPCSGLLRSRDGGQTWGDFTVMACDREKGQIEYGPAAIVAGPQGDLLALISVGSTYLYRTISSDGGQTWSKPEQRLLACNPALTRMGETVACVNQDSQVRGMVRIQFSHNLFDSWRCDRMLDQDIKGENFSMIALDEGRLLMAHDRGGFKPEGRGTPVTKGIEISMMQRNPACPPVPDTIVAANKRDRWEFVERVTVPIEEGLGEMTMTPDGQFLIWSGGKIYTSKDQGKTITPIADAPKAMYNAGVIGQLQSGRWIAAYTDWSDVSEENWRGSRNTFIADDGYLYGKLTGVKGVSKVFVYYSDDRGKTWNGGKEPIDASPLVWANSYGRFIEEADGTIAMTVYGCLSHEDTDTRIDSCGVLRSHDGGESWGDFTLIAHDEKGKEIAYNEVDIQPLPDGTWVAIIRTEWRSHHGGEAASASVSFSRDRGRTWTKPQYSFIGAVSDITLLPDGGLAWIGSMNRARISYDGGHTWSLELPAGADIGGGTGYPGLELVDPNHLFICGRWQGRRGAIYRRVAAGSVP